MKVKIDEQLSQLLKNPLIDAHYKVSTVYDENLSGKLDPELWQIIQKEKYFFITADKEFGDIRKYPPGTHYGVLLLHPKEESVNSYIVLLKSVLKEYSLDNLSGKITVVTPGRIRVRINFDF